MSRRVTLPARTPMAQLSWPRKVRRGFGALLLVSAGAMGVSAMTANTDWGLTSENTR